MNDQTPLDSTASASTRRERSDGGEVAVDVTVSACGVNSQALSDAAGVGVAAALRALEAVTAISLPYDVGARSAQCGRTFVHDIHETTEGTCYGLDGTEARDPEPDLFTEADVPPLPVVIRVNRSVPGGLEVLRPPADGSGIIVLSEGMDWVDLPERAYPDAGKRARR